MFTASSMFTQSDAFSKSSVFTKSSEFSKSSFFTASKEFSGSRLFSSSESPVAGGGNQNKSNKTGMIAGIAAGASAAAVAAGVAIFFFLRRPRIPDVGQLETIDDGVNAINNPNPLYDNQAEDDPFKDDFVNN